MGVVVDNSGLLDVVRAVLDRYGGRGWVVLPREAWWYVTPETPSLRKHGWKIRVSATPLSAPLILARAAEKLVVQGVPFRFVAGAGFGGGAWSQDASDGEFLTVYPQDDDHFRALAWELHHATRGLAGPRILPDRQLCPGSVVHYRYGEFVGERVFTDDGTFEPRMIGPDGSVVVDDSRGFSLPPWAGAPFPDESATAGLVPEPVLLGGRFRVQQVLRHASRGGIYRAVDERHGDAVVIKHALAHTGALLDGTDARDRLRDEARMLDVLAPLKAAPGKVALFEEQGDVFLAREAVPGKPLHQWFSKRATQDGGPGTGKAIRMVRKLVVLLRTVHEAGYVVRDLTPENLMASPGGQVLLINAEHVTEAGRHCAPPPASVFTAPEVTVARSRKTAMRPPEPAADCFSLGTTLFCLLTSLDPRWVTGWDGAEQSAADAEYLLHQISRSHPVLEPFTALITGLTNIDPDERWTLEQAQDFLDQAATEVNTGRPAPPTVARSVALYRPGSVDRLLTDGVAHLGESMTPRSAALWPKSRLERVESDPCNAWWGAAGGLVTLTRFAQVCHDESLRETVARAAAWIDERLFTVPRLLPGLCFGRAGTAWALHDAAGYLGDPAMAGRAVELAKRLPTRWPSADITHGLSGAGMAHLHLWQATGDVDLLQRALACADGVLTAAQRDGDSWTWPVPPDFDSATAGMNSYGFAHGVAGVGAFLLAAAQATAHLDQRPNGLHRLRQAALGAGDTLVAAASVNGGAAWWPIEVGRPLQPPPAMHWCNGPAGIGTFLIRLWAATGDQRFADLAEQASAAAIDNPWQGSISACCGLAGTGQFLLDLAEHTGQAKFRHQAEHIVGVVYAQHTTYNNRLLLCDPAGGTSYGYGTAGILDFILRLRHGGPRPWITTPLPAAPAAAHRARNSSPPAGEHGPGVGLV